MRRFVSATALAMLAAVVPGAASVSHTYYAGGTAVAREASLPTVPPGNQTQTIVDNGGVVCEPAANRGAGGVCIPWNTTTTTDTAITVLDDNVSPSDHIAFQVCIDNDGDGLCTTGQQPVGTCRDGVVFSHGDGDTWANPLGPLQKTLSTSQACLNARANATNVFEGWVVLICTGAHDDQQILSNPHVHPSTTGTVSTTYLGGPPISQAGNFCGGDNERFPPVSKAYRIIP